MRAGYENTRSASEDRAEAFDAEWRTIEDRFNRLDPQGALEQLAQVRNGMKGAMFNRTIDWFARHLSLPPNDHAPWYDDHGLCRMIYMIWPELPVKMFQLDMVPTLFGAMEKYDAEFCSPAIEVAMKSRTNPRAYVEPNREFR